MIYVAFGVPGVGKSAVIEGVVERTGIKHVNWGDLTAEIVFGQNLVKDRDELRKMNFEDQLKIQAQVARKIAEMRSETDELLIETHAAIRTPEGYLTGFNFDSIQQIKPHKFIMIETSAENIMNRRKHDTSGRERKDDRTLEDIRHHLRVTGEMGTTFAVLAGGAFFPVENREGDLEYAVDRISHLIESDRKELADSK